MHHGGLDRIDQGAAKLRRPCFDRRGIDQVPIGSVGQPIAAAAQRAGAVEIGAFGRFTKFESKLNFDDRFGVGGRLGAIGGSERRRRRQPPAM